MAGVKRPSVPGANYSCRRVGLLHGILPLDFNVLLHRANVSKHMNSLQSFGDSQFLVIRLLGCRQIEFATGRLAIETNRRKLSFMIGATARSRPDEHFTKYLHCRSDIRAMSPRVCAYMAGSMSRCCSKSRGWLRGQAEENALCVGHNKGSDGLKLQRPRCNA